MSSGASIYEGYLLKLPISNSQKLRRGWKRRYFILEEDCLRYYTRHQASTAKGDISIRQCSIIDADEQTKREFSFAVVLRHTNPNQHLYLRAVSLSQKQNWMNALTKASNMESESHKNVSDETKPQHPAVETQPREVFQPALAIAARSFLVLPRMVWELPDFSYDGEVDSAGHRHGRGTCQAGDVVFQGEWTNGIPQSRGVHVWDDARKYSGQWQNGLPHGFGRLESAEGRVYEGEWFEGEPHGEGRLEELDGSVYEGTFVHKIRKGVGSTRWTNQNVYTGDFDDDTMHGAGILVYGDGSHYEGEFRFGMLHGKGELCLANGNLLRGRFDNDSCVEGEIIYANQSRYEGPIRDGKRHGAGRMIWANGDVYIGEFIEDVRWNKGSFASSKGDEYDGEWARDVQNGVGKMSYRNGNQYHGEWLDGKRHGKGEFFYRSGNRYRGEYVDGFPHGKGIFYYKEGHRYTGEFVRGKKTGNGSVVFSDGRTYEGEWKNDELCGEGVMQYTNGDKFVGMWRNYKWNGAGNYHFANGNVYIANFEEGHFPEIGTMQYANGNRFQGRIDRQGRRQGTGIMFWSNGERFEGTFRHDKRHGKDCVMYLIDGTEAVGDYDMGVAVRVEMRSKPLHATQDETKSAEPECAEPTKKAAVKNWFGKNKKKKPNLEVVDYSNDHLDANSNRTATGGEEEEAEVLTRTSHLVLPRPSDAGHVLDDLGLASGTRVKISARRSTTTLQHVKDAHNQPQRLWSTEESNNWKRISDKRHSIPISFTADNTPAVRARGVSLVAPERHLSANRNHSAILTSSPESSFLRDNSGMTAISSAAAAIDASRAAEKRVSFDRESDEDHPPQAISASPPANAITQSATARSISACELAAFEPVPVRRSSLYDVFIPAECHQELVPSFASLAKNSAVSATDETKFESGTLREVPSKTSAEEFLKTQAQDGHKITQTTSDATRPDIRPGIVDEHTAATFPQETEQALPPITQAAEGTTNMKTVPPKSTEPEMETSEASMSNIDFENRQEEFCTAAQTPQTPPRESNIPQLNETASNSQHQEDDPSIPVVAGDFVPVGSFPQRSTSDNSSLEPSNALDGIRLAIQETDDHDTTTQSFTMESMALFSEWKGDRSGINSVNTIQIIQSPASLNRKGSGKEMNNSMARSGANVSQSHLRISEAQDQCDDSNLSMRSLSSCSRNSSIIFEEDESNAATNLASGGGHELPFEPSILPWSSSRSHSAISIISIPPTSPIADSKKIFFTKELDTTPPLKIATTTDQPTTESAFESVVKISEPEQSTTESTPLIHAPSTSDEDLSPSVNQDSITQHAEQSNIDIGVSNVAQNLLVPSFVTQASATDDESNAESTHELSSVDESNAVPLFSLSDVSLSANSAPEAEALIAQEQVVSIVDNDREPTIEDAQSVKAVESQKIASSPSSSRYLASNVARKLSSRMNTVSGPAAQKPARNSTHSLSLQRDASKATCKSEELVGIHAPGAYTNLILDEWDTRDLVEWLEDNRLAVFSGAFVDAKLTGGTIRQYEKRVVELPINLNSFNRVHKATLILGIERLFADHQAPVPIRDSIRMWQGNVSRSARHFMLNEPSKNGRRVAATNNRNSTTRKQSTILRLQQLWEAKSEVNSGISGHRYRS